MSECIYVTDEYPNPPQIRYVPVHQPCSIGVEVYKKPTIKEKIKNCFKRFKKEQKVMKFKVGDKVRIKKPGSYHNNMVAVITKDNYESITDKLGYQIRIGEETNPHGCVWFNEELELIERAAFTKSDLKDGMVVENREGTVLLLVGDTLMNEKKYMIFTNIKDDLTHKMFRDLDIVKVYTTKGNTLSTVLNISNLTLIWERKEEPDYKEMTVAEIEKKLGYKVKIVGEV
jgi:uncharacterized protein YodC (DUF2158 family)